MTDPTIEMLNVSARALREAVATEKIEPRVYRDMGQTIIAIAEAFEAEADALTRTEPDPTEAELLKRHEEAVTESRGFGGVVNGEGEPLFPNAGNPEWKAEQFQAGNYFSEPESADPAAWATATREGMIRAQQMSPLEMDAYFAHILAGYGRRRQAETQRSLAVEASNLRIEVPAGESPLEVAIGVRDEIARRLRAGRL